MKLWTSFLTAITSLLLFSQVLFAVEPSSHTSDTTKSKADPKSLFTSNELNWLIKNKALTYVYDPDWAPFEWKDDSDQHSGIIADIINLIKNRSGLEFIAMNTDTWDESVNLVKNKKADMFSAITITKERETYLNFTSNDIFTYPAVLITNFEDKAVYLDVEKDIKGKKIGIVKSSGLGRYIKEKYPKLEYVELASTLDGFTAIRKKKIDMFAINTITAKHFIEKKRFDDLKIALKLDYIYRLKIAVHKDLPGEIISILDKTLNSISEEEKNTIFKKWTEVPGAKQTNWKLLLQISAVLIAIILFLAWSNRKLNVMVKARTEELTHKNIDLKKALEEIKVLRGIIPICSYCHKIRDDEGSWDQLEAYLTKHSNAEFSHGICPNCLSKARKDEGLD